MTTDQFTIKDAPINWQCNGKFNFTTGYGATKAESVIANYAAFIAPVILYYFAWKSLDWSVLQVVVAALFDLGYDWWSANKLTWVNEAIPLYRPKSRG